MHTIRGQSDVVISQFPGTVNEKGNCHVGYYAT
jgi:hypothetical protein